MNYIAFLTTSRLYTSYRTESLLDRTYTRYAV